MNLLKSLAAILFFLSFVFAGPGSAKDISGQYKIEGANPGGAGLYSGKVAVAASGETYQVVWILGKAQHRGTGILQGDIFSVVYQPKGEAPGVAVYQVGKNGTLTGRWTNLTGQTVGTESWVPDSGI